MSCVVLFAGKPPSTPVSQAHCDPPAYKQTPAGRTTWKFGNLRFKKFTTTRRSHFSLAIRMTDSELSLEETTSRMNAIAQVLATFFDFDGKPEEDRLKHLEGLFNNPYIKAYALIPELELGDLFMLYWSRYCALQNAGAVADQEARGTLSLARCYCAAADHFLLQVIQ